jgi:ribose transport system ATP-binding protein
MRPAVLEAEGISKLYDGETALDSMSLSVFAGEIHGLLGHNGSGKSTFIKILAGVVRPEPGSQLRVDGVPVHLPSPHDFTRQHGIGFVHQDLGLVDSATVAENLLVRSVSTGMLRWVGWRREQRICGEILERWGIDTLPTHLVSELTPVQRALVAMARALHELGVTPGALGEGARLLVLDEPTASLPRHEVTRVMDVVRSLSRAGVATLFVSHKSEEILELTDRVTVLRDGRTVATAETQELDAGKLKELILGLPVEPPRAGRADLGETSGPVDTRRGATAPLPSLGASEAVVAIIGLESARVHDLSFTVSKGEVLGFAGLAGSGAGDVPGLLFGSRPAAEGLLTIRGRTVPLQDMRPATAVQLGMALVPADRVNEGGIGDLSLTENAAPVIGNAYTDMGALRWSRLRRALHGLLVRFGVRPPRPERWMATLSGGNQQKFIIAKWLGAKPDLLLLDEPTHGVDVGAVAEIIRIIGEAKRSGMALLCLSTDEGDLAELADRVIVLRGGIQVAELVGGEITKERIRREIG